MSGPARTESLQLKLEANTPPPSQAAQTSNADTQFRLEDTSLALGASPVQRKALNAALVQFAHSGGGAADVQAVAAQGLSGSAGRLPYVDTIQRAFGSHDITSTPSHVGGAAETASKSLGAEAYATGGQIAFKKSPDLHTAAHEAAHVVQQRQGVYLAGGVGRVGDPYEQHADAVADAVVQGKSAESLLTAGVGGSASATQRVIQKEEAADNPETEAPEAKEGEAASPDTSDLTETKERLQLLETAVTTALSMATAAMGNAKLGNAKYKLWMDGAAESDTDDQATKDRVAHVLDGYTKIKKSLEEDKIIFKKWDLPATHKFKYNNVYAYVRSGEKDNNMYLGGVFWVAKMKGIDSKGGTIVHELSHRLHATSDHHYGTSKSKSSAASAPATATTNADNYEHLAESS